MTLLLALRDMQLPFPGLAIGSCPWTDLSNAGESMTTNDVYDFINKPMADQWTAWYTVGTNVRNPLVPPIHLQAGAAEILHDMILAFADCADQQGVNVKLEIRKNMPHDLAFGDMTNESKGALERIGEIVREYVAYYSVIGFVSFLL